ncbi:hypothetical protein SBA2_310015 [Acidobacteriia bacterium SbA2]|nr:hypothetical protein SBA2_310015 [Acidobacteriia bacterium SbA2]
MGGFLGPFGAQFERLGDMLINKVADEVFGDSGAARSTRVVIYNHSSQDIYFLSSSFDSGGFTAGLATQRHPSRNSGRLQGRVPRRHDRSYGRRREVWIKSVGQRLLPEDRHLKSLCGRQHNVRGCCRGPDRQGDDLGWQYQPSRCRCLRGQQLTPRAVLATSRLFPTHRANRRSGRPSPSCVPTLR